MSKVNSWEVTDEFWMRAQALIPVRQRVPGKTYVRRAGVGRRPKNARLVFEGIVSIRTDSISDSHSKITRHSHPA